MFGPLHMGKTAIECTGGYITPIPYLVHSMEQPSHPLWLQVATWNGGKAIDGAGS